MPSSDSENPLISVIVVNYKVPEEICQLMRSLRSADGYDKAEVIVVDNASQDNSKKIVTEEFPEVQWISLKKNIGFGKACNVAAKKSNGEYFLFINPDTLVSQDTLTKSVSFMENNPTVGVMGPKIIDGDGNFQKQCRRSFPTPMRSFAYMLRLNKIFPNVKAFSKYDMSDKDPDESMEVDAISGSYMFFRADLYRKIGGFDKDFFMYGEDLDICVQCKLAGYSVWYNPEIQIIHFKGKSSSKNQIQARIAFYDAMIIFSRKYRDSYGTFFPTWLLTLGIVIQGALNIFTIILKSLKASILDCVLINTIFALVMSVRFYLKRGTILYFDHGFEHLFIIHTILTVLFIAIFLSRGVYSSDKGTIKNVAYSGGIASLLFIAVVFFIKDLAVSRIVYGMVPLLSTLALIAWRAVILKSDTKHNNLFVKGKVIIIGDNDIAARIIDDIEREKRGEISAIVWPRENDSPPAFKGYPVIGKITEIKKILQQESVSQILIATDVSWYSHIIEALSSIKKQSLIIKWVPPEVFKSPQNYTDTIPLKDFSV